MTKEYPEGETTPLFFAEEPQSEYNRQRNEEMRAAWRIIEHTAQNLFLTGKAGTGKTTFLKTLRQHTAKRLVVLAPTGIAAINAGGMTIHSFFQFPQSPFFPGIGFPDRQRRHDRFSREKLRTIKTMDILVIDEISMVRADILDAIDSALRRHRNPSLPFGGVQLLLIGDLQQLAPVARQAEWEMLREHYATPYFFSSNALKSTAYDTIELKQVYRQDDDHFVDLLNRVRTNTADTAVLNELNRRYIPGFKPDASEGYIRLTTHNRLAQRINDDELSALSTPVFKFNATVKGEFPESSYPTDATLTLREGAQVMFLRNDAEAGYYNGLMGRVVRLSQNEVIVRPHGMNHNISVNQAEWENTRFAVDSSTGKMTEEVQGTFSQLPLRLAWAITIHKSQGLTFDKAIIDASASFAHGQTYVALSRCKSLEGLVLDSPLKLSAIINDADVVSFTDSHCGEIPSESHINSLIVSYTASCLSEMFDMTPLRIAFDNLRRIVEEYLSRDYPKLKQRYDEMTATLNDDVESVSRNFMRQYNSAPVMTPATAERVRRGCIYFIDKLNPLIRLVGDTPRQTDNKTVTTRLQSALGEISETLFLKTAIMTTMSESEFSPKNYLDAKARATLSIEAGTTSVNSNPTAKAKKTSKTSTGRQPEVSQSEPSDILNPELYDELTKWRRRQMELRQAPAYVIMSNRAMMWIAANLPTDLRQLAEAPGIGKNKLQLYGKELIEIVDRHISERH